MYQLKVIGTLQVQGGLAEITIKSDYKKALKSVDCFSHIHVFYIEKEQENYDLKTAIGSIELVDVKQGKILLKDCSAFKKPAEVVDIKPYFPCEDSVKAECKIIKGGKKHIDVKNIVALKQENNQTTSKAIHKTADQIVGEYALEKIGVIRNTYGEIFIQLEKEVDVQSDFVKVIWWFDRFDDSKYRKAVECNPPYENAPRTGIFATRSPVRPNPIAMTVARVKKIDPYEKRIYLSGIESFDKTPCLGVLAYNPAKDCKIDVAVPTWLSHWPKWLEDGMQDDKSDATYELEVENLMESSLVSLLKEESHKLENTQDFFEEERSMDVQYHDKLSDGIWIYGARENNLKGLNVKIPYHQITAVVGVSGSGKSSLVKDTIYSECKRRMEYLNSDQNILQKPNIEYMSGCIPAVMISQKAIKGNLQSTIGTYTNIYDDLRMIFASIGMRHCPKCGGEIIPLTKEQIISILCSKLDTMENKGIQIFDLEKHLIEEGTLETNVTRALERGKGALYVRFDEEDFILMQTRQKCYRCDHLMFELTPSTFSYMDPENRCPRCNGTSRVVEVDPQKVIEKPELSLLEGASSFWGKLKTFKENPNANWIKGQVLGLANKMNVDLELPWRDLPESFKEKVLNGSREMVIFSYDNKKNGRKGEIERPVEGALTIIKRLYEENNGAKAMEKYMSEKACDYCKGERLNKEGRMVTIGALRYPQVAAMSFEALYDWCRSLPKQIGRIAYEKVRTQVARIIELTQSAMSLGIGYLEMNRGTATLSGGEGQRIKLLTAMQNHMTGLLYVFDEPSKGLHPKDYQKVIQMIQSLKEEGNTVIMVEHNEDMMRIADYVIEIGPTAGKDGGFLVASGSLEAVMEHAGTQLNRYLGRDEEKRFAQEKHISKVRTSSLDFLEMKHLCLNNLKDISISFPKKALTCICGVSGSGKSTLMKGEMYAYYSKDNTFDEVCLVDQLPIGRSSRSVVATYIDIMDAIRAEMAKTEGAISLGYDEKAFSFNGEIGQCETCKGDGNIKLKYLEEATMLCPDCKGKRYKKDVLKILYKEKSIADLLEMSVSEALVFWKGNEEIVNALEVIHEVGLGYLKLGQSTTTLSGGEASRLKLAKQLMSVKQSSCKKKTKKSMLQNTLYLLDEPTTGLHFSDIDHMLSLIHKLIEAGNTVVAIEHNKLFLSQCDWMIELGPEAGKAGGEVIYQGVCKA